MRIASILSFVFAAMAVVACAANRAEAPLAIPLGTSHVDTEQALSRAQFCRTPGQIDNSHEFFPRCDRTNAETGDAWVTAVFEGDKLVELRRFERYTDDAQAVARWNDMVAARGKLSAPVDSLGRALPAGTRSSKAFRTDDGALVAVILLTPTPPENANILELVFRTPGQ